MKTKRVGFLFIFFSVCISPAVSKEILIKNAHIMTVTHGTIQNGALLIRDGKIAAVGTDLKAPSGAEVIDASGQWITPGLIDCHSHIAADSINEGSVSVSSMAGIQDDAWRVADFLKENNVRVILGPRQALPPREDDPIDIIYRTPAILHEKGVSFAIATGDSADSRTLPYEVGNAVAYGLPYETALRSITLTPAEFLGVADQVGSVAKGKKANLVVATGDILEYQTEIKHLFINGQPVSLETKHTRLYDKYRKRP